MNKLSIVLLAAFVCGTTAHAGSISFDGRVDMLSNDFDDASSSADHAKFNIETARIDAKGKLGDSVSYRARFRLNKNRATVNRDTTGADLDYANLTNKFNDSVSLTVGKLATDVGGIEGATSGPDLYMKTIGYSGATPATGQSIFGTDAVRYATGAKVAYLMGDHEIALGFTNLAADSSGPGNNGTASQFNQNKYMTGLVYKGGFMDKKLTAVASYHSQAGKLSGGGADDDKSKNTLMAVGVKYDAEMFAVEADYLADKAGSYTTADKDDDLTTIQVGFAYKMDQWTPRVKVESSTATVNTSAATAVKWTYTGTQIALEYKPVKDDMFRYHLAYWSRETKNDVTGSTATTDKQIILGTRILADFLK